MKKYKVIRDCHGFQRRHWLKDSIVELDDSENPPHHFVLINEEKAVEIKDPMAPVPATLSTLASYHNTPAIKTGMAVGLEKMVNPIVGRKKTVKK